MTDDANSETSVVTAFLRHESDVLLLRRSDEVGSHPGRWGAVAGHAEGDPDGAARTEISEETGLDPDATLVRAGDPFSVADADLGTRWLVRPYLFDCETRSIEPNYETAAFEWVPPTEILRRETVPELWTSYDRVRPTPETIAADREHGSAYLSVRALEVLRDEAALAAAGDEGDDSAAERDWSDLAATARDLRDARPAMPVVENRVNRALDAAAEERTAAALEAAAEDGIERALRADAEAAERAAEVVGTRVATLSRSGTVIGALEAVDPEFVLVAESRPGREGVATAERIAAETDATVRLTTDAAFAGRLAAADVDALLVGADAILAGGESGGQTGRGAGRLVNKVGTRGAVTAAAREGVDCYAVAASDKITYRTAFDPEERDPADVYDGDADLSVASPAFEATPLDRFDAVLTERGPLGVSEIGEVAERHRARSS